MQPQILEVAPERPSRKRPLIVLVGMLVVGALTAATMSLAIFTDTASVDGNAFTAGKIAINATPASTLVAFTNQFPGKVVGPNALLVSNEGTGEMRYAVTSTSTNLDTKGLAAQLDLHVTIMTPETTCATDPTPTLIYNGPLSDATCLDRRPCRGRTDRRPNPRGRRFGDALLHDHVPAVFGQHVHARSHGHYLHLRRRADLRQPVSRST